MSGNKTNYSKSNRCRRLQLYNNAHKAEFEKLFWQVKSFRFAADEAFEVSDDEAPNFVGKDEVKMEQELAGKHCCTSCRAVVEDVNELRDHFRLDWHRYNVKRKVHGQDPVTELYFYEMIDDLSSIEGSDSEEDSSTIDSSKIAISKLIDQVSRLPIHTQKNEKSDFKSLNKAVNSPKVYFENENGQIIGMYKILAEILGLKDENGFTKNLLKSLENPLNLAIVMCSGGHFAAAVFQGNEIVLHKTFHSYTVRAKQGGSQGTKDSKSGTSHPKSAGASLRRYNEQSFAQHVQELMVSWDKRLSVCPVIFFRAVGSSANVLFGGKSPPFQKEDSRLKTIPFPTKRPTFLEVKRVHSIITALHVYISRDEFTLDHMSNSGRSKNASPKKTKMYRAKSKSPKRRNDHNNPIVAPAETFCDEEQDTESDEILEITETVDTNDLREYDDSLSSDRRKKKKMKKPKPVPFKTPDGVFGLLINSLNHKMSDVNSCLISLQQEKNLSDNLEQFIQQLNQCIDSDGSTLLHLASSKNAFDAIGTLLDIGCDPAIKNKAGKYPYNCAETKEGRLEYRKFMGKFPEKYDYQKAQIPPPLSEAMEAEKAEKKKLLNKLKREKEKQKKMEKKEKEAELDEQDRFLKLSDREKRALAAEQRILAQCKRNSAKTPVLVRCFECASDITGKIPFEYLQNIFCTTKCLNTHRKKFPTPLSVS